MSAPRHHLVIDLEATCDEGGRLDRREMETIEIGAVLVDVADGFRVVDELGAFVRPVRHPTLTPFCTRLTTITQAQVDAAPRFPVVFEALLQRLWLPYAPDVVFCSWGNFDRVQFERDCRLHGVEYPFGPEHLNLKEAFAKGLKPRRKLGMAGALAVVGLALEGTHHRGLDDARNIARLLPWCLGLRPMPEHAR